MDTQGHPQNTRAAIEALSFVPPGRLRWAGEPIRVAPPSVAHLRSLLIDQLAALLYDRFYCYGRVTPLASRPAVSREALVDARLVEDLIRANRAAARWEAGWRRIDSAGAYVQVERGGLRMFLGSHSWRDDPERPTGQACFPSGSLGLSPGFYVVTSGDPLANGEVVRLYWNVSPAGASRLVHAVTTLLADVAGDFQLKVLVALSQYGRADTAVLYLPQQRVAQAASALRAVNVAVRHHLRPDVPAFTHQLAAGVAIAEQPPGGESFGRHRCRLLGEAIVLASEAGLRTTDQRLTFAANHFASHGLSWDRPHLNPGSDRSYPIGLSAVSVAPRPRTATPNRQTFLEHAVGVGEELVRTAVWHGAECNWVGGLIGSSGGYGALGADLYAGTIGIALFLAELFRATGQQAFRRTAAGAVYQACAGHVVLGVNQEKGLYSGWAGIASTAWYCAELLEMPALMQAANAALRRLARLAGGPVTADIMGGEAGAILALLGIGDERCVRLATRFGTALVAAANRRGNRWSWQTTNARGYRDLTGFSHGTAGIAMALLLLFERTGRPEFREAAIGALRYERTCYDPVEKNWFDLRELRPRDKPKRFAVAWCHGAPGIALSRTVAARFPEIAADGAADVSAALDTTRAAIRVGLNGDTSFCLCHGLAGNADILTLLGNLEDRALAIEVAQLGKARSARGGCGSFGGAEHLPGLMTGRAGIGMFYLRLYDPEIQSPLWPVPKQPAGLRERAA
ncbi:MAG: lanthionine synthetase LanC family protein [Rhodopila sp.]|nr:lanthionine synthetase LanC family protein [Rhodopila sp.]